MKRFAALSFFAAVGVMTMAFLFSGCGGGGGGGGSSSDSSATGVDFVELRSLPVESSIKLEIPTYDGSNQLVHPDVIVHNGLIYMAATPYPWGNVEYENPSFYVSSDGVNFIPAADNPLVDHPDGGFNADPDLVVDPATGEFRVYYVEMARDLTDQYLAVLRSPNGTDWVDHRKLTEFKATKGDPFVVSPAMVLAGGKYYMFHVEVDTDPTTHSPRLCRPDPYTHVIKVMTSSDGITWDKGSDTPVAIDLPAGFHPWHLDVVQGGGRYYMLLDGYRGSICDHHFLYLAVSDDLAHWRFIPTPVVTPADAVMPNIKILYRSTAVVDGDDMWIYFSFYTTDNRWFVGLKHIRISDYVK
ncbi:MAG: hypothetical protein GXO16_04690 [Epsilonproteobacteria bacterium]|nr:hypothetical protein [Campylobacterota bacterium]